MNNRIWRHLFYLIFLVNTIISAQSEVINVWQGKIPGSIKNDEVKEITYLNEKGSERTQFVTTPTLSVFLPEKEKANGTAVVICPGGGYMRLAIPPEGFNVARWLNKNGIAAFVLKYRLPDDRIMVNKSIGPLQDAQEAFRIVRRNHLDWGIDENKIGIMGFSAGGHLASTLSTHYNDKVYECDSISARPDFSILIYPVISMQKGITHSGSRNYLLGDNPDPDLVDSFSNEMQVDAHTPTAFLVHSEKDKTVPVENSINYFLSLRKYSIPAEIHIFENGSHGYGLAVGRNGTEAYWPDMCLNWLRVHGLL